MSELVEIETVDIKVRHLVNQAAIFRTNAEVPHDVEVGASTSFFIVQYQSYLAQARATVVVAKSAYLKARAALERAVGSILDDNHVILSDAMRGR